MKPLIIIDGFEYGMISDETIPARNGFHSGCGVDIHSKEGVLQVSQRMNWDTESTTNYIGTGGPYNIERYDKNSSCLYYTLIPGIGTTTTPGGFVYGRLSNTWHRLHALGHNNTLTIGGMRGFGDTLYYCSDGQVGETVNTTVVLDSASDSTEIRLNKTKTFPASGDICVETESISYTANDDTKGILSGLSRGQNGTTAATHVAGKVAIGFNDTFKTLKAQDNKYHPMEEYLAKLNIGDGRYVATIEPGGTFDDDALILPKDYRASSLKVFGDELVIGTYRGTNFWDYPESTLFTWNGVSELPEKTFNIRESAITALETWKNRLMVFAGVKGNIYQYNGASVNKFKTISGIASTTYAYVHPEATGIVEGNLLFGLSGTRKRCIPGIYCLGQKEPTKPIALTLKHVNSSGVLANDQNEWNITSLFPIIGATYNEFYVGSDDNASAGSQCRYKIDYLNSLTKLPSGGYWESQVYEIPRDNFPRILKGVGVVMSNTDGTVNIKYKLDGAGGWYGGWSTLGEADYQNPIVKGINQRARTIQLRLEFEPYQNVSPQIKQIHIY